MVEVLYSGEEFDVTMFFDTMNDAFKDTIVDKINHYLHIAQKCVPLCRPLSSHHCSRTRRTRHTRHTQHA
jgi:hypothetical protein